MDDSRRLGGDRNGQRPWVRPVQRFTAALVAQAIGALVGGVLLARVVDGSDGWGDLVAAVAGVQIGGWLAGAILLGGGLWRRTHRRWAAVAVALLLLPSHVAGIAGSVTLGAGPWLALAAVWGATGIVVVVLT